MQELEILKYIESLSIRDPINTQYHNGDRAVQVFTRYADHDDFDFILAVFKQKKGSEFFSLNRCEILERIVFGTVQHNFDLEAPCAVNDFNFEETRKKSMYNISIALDRKLKAEL